MSDEKIDWYGTGLALICEHGDGAVEMAAAILQSALSEMLAQSLERRIVGVETTRSPRKIALQAIGAFETAGAMYLSFLAKMPPEKRREFDEALKARARKMLAEAQREAG